MYVGFAFGLLRMVAGRRPPFHKPSLLFCTLRAAESPLSIVQVCIVLPCRAQLATAAFQDVQVYFLCLLRGMAGGRRPSISKFTFVVSFFAAYGGRSRAAVQCIHVFVHFLRRMAGSRRSPFSISRWILYLSAEYGGRPKAAFQYIQLGN